MKRLLSVFGAVMALGLLASCANDTQSIDVHLDQAKTYTYYYTPSGTISTSYLPEKTNTDIYVYDSGSIYSWDSSTNGSITFDAEEGYITLSPIGLWKGTWKKDPTDNAVTYTFTGKAYSSRKGEYESTDGTTSRYYNVVEDVSILLNAYDGTVYSYTNTISNYSSGEVVKKCSDISPESGTVEFSQSTFNASYSTRIKGYDWSLKLTR